MLNPWRVAASHEDLFVQRYSRLLGMSLQITGHDRQQAEDLVHEAFVEFTLSRPDIDAIQNLEAYLYGMLRNMHLSHVRRAARRHTHSLPLLDYDSAEIGLRSSDPRDRIRAQDELRDVCSYACIRKETSKAGSVLLLRFFHGYFPVEIAEVLRSPRRAVDDWLRIARREARLYLENPRRLNPIKPGLAVSMLRIAAGRTAGDFLNELRNAIFRSRQGACLPPARLRELYLTEEADSIDSAVLGHIVSCEQCLDEVNRLLGLPPLSERFPTDMIGPDTRSNGGAGDGSSGNDSSKPAKSLGRRAKEVFEHAPKELRISVNGFILGSQSIGSEVNEQTLNVSSSEKIGFVEVFSEQEIRLAFISVEPPPDGPVQQPTRVELSEGRTIDLLVSFGDAWPTVKTLYFDPALASPPLQSEPALEREAPAAAYSDGPSGLPSLLSRLWRRTAAPGALLRPSTITGALAILLIAVLVLLKLPERPVLAAELLGRASALEDAATADSGVVVHRVFSLEERAPSNGALIDRRKIELWTGGPGALKARRVYDEQGKLIAGAWTSADGSGTICRKGIPPQVFSADDKGAIAMDPSSMWLFEPSARGFSSLIPAAEAATVEVQNATYVIRYESLGSANGNLLRATLTLNRADLRPVEQTLLVRNAGGLSEYHLAESRFERLSPAAIAPKTYQPDRELLDAVPDRGKPGGARPADSTAPLPAPVAVSATQFAEIEVEALYQMHSIGVCLREQAEVAAVGGTLHIQAIVETEGRKSEVLRVLGGVMRSPAVTVEVSTVAEASLRQANLPAGPPRLARVERDSGRRPVDADLRAYFSAQGEADSGIEEQAGRFASRVLVRSREALRHAWALKRHIKDFARAELAGPEAEAKLRAMLREHARVIVQETRALRADLQPIFFVQAPSGDSKEAAEGGAFADRASAIERLLEMASSHEKAIRNAFALSAGGQPMYVKSDQFWRSLQGAENLAAKLQEWP